MNNFDRGCPHCDYEYECLECELDEVSQLAWAKEAEQIKQSKQVSKKV